MDEKNLLNRAGITPEFEDGVTTFMEWTKSQHAHMDVEPHNVRLDLCTDGFAPHGEYDRTYFCCPIILTSYNLPPRMCMSSEYIFLTMVIPDPWNSKRLINVYLEPLIEELGEQSFDRGRGQGPPLPAAPSSASQMTYWWDCDNESMFWVFHMWAGKYIQKTFFVSRSSLIRPLWLANEMWLQLQAYWASENFQQESSKNKENRAAKQTASSTVYRGGSSAVSMHKRKLEAKLDRPPKQMEVIERCYKKKEEDGRSGPRATKLMEDHQPQATANDGPTPTESEALVEMI
ncbi:hypothetical protein Sango_1868900 [Sesamum angolense]|uniref:Uncharacterized protein n=1 Tax=Sesamum angolense TaxID=2727404 RepID=A0AAE2BQF6_9LAMI|nr:hypothetical protein Sango_1868900 [Sesamum angolense]